MLYSMRQGAHVDAAHCVVCALCNAFSDVAESELPGTGDAGNWHTMFEEANRDLLGPRESTGFLQEDVPPIEKEAMGWCGFCGNRCGWVECGACNGKGAYVTKPGLAGVSGVVGLARCKSCFGWKATPCLICGVKDRTEWMEWQEYARRNPAKVSKG